MFVYKRAKASFGRPCSVKTTSCLSQYQFSVYIHLCFVPLYIYASSFLYISQLKKNIYIIPTTTENIIYLLFLPFHCHHPSIPSVRNYVLLVSLRSYRVKVKSCCFVYIFFLSIPSFFPEELS